MPRRCFGIEGRGIRKHRQGFHYRRLPDPITNLASDVTILSSYTASLASLQKKDGRENFLASPSTSLVQNEDHTDVESIATYRHMNHRGYPPDDDDSSSFSYVSAHPSTVITFKHNHGNERQNECNLDSRKIDNSSSNTNTRSMRTITEAQQNQILCAVQNHQRLKMKNSVGETRSQYDGSITQRGLEFDVASFQSTPRHAHQPNGSPWYHKGIQPKPLHVQRLSEFKDYKWQESQIKIPKPSSKNLSNIPQTKYTLYTKSPYKIINPMLDVDSKSTKSFERKRNLTRNVQPLKPVSKVGSQQRGLKLVRNNSASPKSDKKQNINGTASNMPGSDVGNNNSVTSAIDKVFLANKDDPQTEFPAGNSRKIGPWLYENGKPVHYDSEAVEFDSEDPHRVLSVTARFNSSRRADVFSSCSDSSECSITYKGDVTNKDEVGNLVIKDERMSLDSRNCSRGEWLVYRDYRATSNSQYGGSNNIWKNSDDREPGYNQADKSNNPVDLAHMVQITGHSKTGQHSYFARIEKDKEKNLPRSNLLEKFSIRNEGITVHQDKNEDKTKITSKIAELAQTRHRKFHVTRNRLHDDKGDVKEVHSEFYIGKELSPRNRPASRKSNSSPHTRDTSREKSPFPRPWIVRPHSVEDGSKRSTEREWVNTVKTVYNSTEDLRTHTPDRQSKDKLKRQEISKVICDVDKVQLKKAKSLQTVNKSEDKIEELLDYFWSYQGMGRQFQSSDLIHRKLGYKGKQPKHIEIDFGKFNRLPPIDSNSLLKDDEEKLDPNSQVLTHVVCPKIDTVGLDGSQGHTLVKTTVSNIDKSQHVHLVVTLPNANEIEQESLTVSPDQTFAQ